MSYPPAFTAKQLRAMSDEKLAGHWSGYKSNTGDWFLAEMEVKRRQGASNELRGWLSLAISVLALALSLVAFYFNISR